MMSEAQILAAIKKEIQRFFRVPGLINTAGSIKGIAREVFYNEPPYSDKAQTTSATEVEIKNIEVEDGETGLLEIRVIGLKDDGSESNVSKQLIKYKKTGGTLTLTNIDTLDDYDTAGASVNAIVDIDDNISIKVAGAAATTIDWDLYTNKFNKTATALP